MLRKLSTGSRYLLGLIYFVFGLNGFLNFLPMPPHPEAAGSFLGALAATGYFFPFLKGTEVIAGLLLLTGIAAPVALVILAPITLQIFLFHAVLTPGLQNSVLPIAMILLNIGAAVNYWPLFKALFATHKKAEAVSQAIARTA